MEVIQLALKKCEMRDLMIKLIASDMDGTLLNASHEISEENIAAIQHAQSLGIRVVIATGRAF